MSNVKINCNRVQCKSQDYWKLTILFLIVETLKLSWWPLRVPQPLMISFVLLKVGNLVIFMPIDPLRRLTLTTFPSRSSSASSWFLSSGLIDISLGFHHLLEPTFFVFSKTKVKISRKAKTMKCFYNKIFMANVCRHLIHSISQTWRFLMAVSCLLKKAWKSCYVWLIIQEHITS